MRNKVPDLRPSLIVDRENENQRKNHRSCEEVLSCHISLQVAAHVVSFICEGRLVTVIYAEEAEWIRGQ